MKWRKYSYEEKVAHIQKKYGHWRKWFAWYPVQINDHMHWFEVVYRRGVADSKNYYFKDTPKLNWEYARDLFHVMQIEEEKLNKLEQSKKINFLTSSIPTHYKASIINTVKLGPGKNPR